MRTLARLRTRQELADALAARHETLALLLGNAVQKIIRSRRAIVAARLQLILGRRGR